MNGLQTAAESNSISDQHKSWKGQWRKQEGGPEMGQPFTNIIWMRVDLVMKKHLAGSSNEKEILKNDMESMHTVKFLPQNQLGWILSHVRLSITNLQGITCIECENHHELDPYTYDRSDKCTQEQEKEHTQEDTQETNS